MRKQNGSAAYETNIMPVAQLLSVPAEETVAQGDGGDLPLGSGVSSASLGEASGPSSSPSMPPGLQSCAVSEAKEPAWHHQQTKVPGSAAERWSRAVWGTWPAGTGLGEQALPSACLPMGPRETEAPLQGPGLFTQDMLCWAPPTHPPPALSDPARQLASRLDLGPSCGWQDLSSAWVVMPGTQGPGELPFIPASCHPCGDS